MASEMRFRSWNLRNLAVMCLAGEGCSGSGLLPDPPIQSYVVCQFPVPQDKAMFGIPGKILMRNDMVSPCSLPSGNPINRKLFLCSQFSMSSGFWGRASTSVTVAGGLAYSLSLASLRKPRRLLTWEMRFVISASLPSVSLVVTQIASCRGPSPFQD